MPSISEQIKTKQVERFHLIYGEEAYMVRYYKNAMISALSTPGDEMNCTVFQGSGIVPSEIADVAVILPFMAANRLIVVQNSGFCNSSSDMTDYFDSFPDTTYIVFVEQQVDKRNKLYKWIQKNGCVTECKHQNTASLCTWIAGYLSRFQKKISKNCAEYMISRIGNDMEFLTNELDKLISYTGEKKAVEIEDVDAVCGGVTEGKIFDLLDAVAVKDRSKALILYKDLLDNREPVPVFLSMFRRHINILLKVKDGLLKGMDKGRLAAYAGVPPFTLNNYTKQASAVKRTRLIEMLEQAAQAEENYKTGQMSDQISLELFLIQALTNA